MVREMSKAKSKRILILAMSLIVILMFSGFNANAITQQDDTVSQSTSNQSIDETERNTLATNTYTINVNRRYSNQHKRDSSHYLKYKITIPEAGVVTPVVYINEEKNNLNLNINAYLYNTSLTTAYSSPENYKYNSEDASGHQWTIVKYNKCRIPAGTYYLNFGNISGFSSYGYFDLEVKYSSEGSRTNVERESNDSRNTANAVELNKTYYGNNHYNDVDYYKFSFDKTTKISLLLYNSSGSWSGNFQPCVVDNDGNDLGGYSYLGREESSNGIEYQKYEYNLTLKPGTYFFRVSNFYTSFDDYKIIVRTTPSKVQGLKLTASGSRKIKLSFKTATRATSYEIYRKQSGSSWKKVKTTTSKSWTNSGLKKGRTYYYRVRAINGSTKGSFSSTMKKKAK